MCVCVRLKCVLYLTPGSDGPLDFRMLVWRLSGFRAPDDRICAVRVKGRVRRGPRSRNRA